MAKESKPAASYSEGSAQLSTTQASPSMKGIAAVGMLGVLLVTFAAPTEPAARLRMFLWFPNFPCLVIQPTKHLPTADPHAAHAETDMCL